MIRWNGQDAMKYRIRVGIQEIRKREVTTVVVIRALVCAVVVRELHVFCRSGIRLEVFVFRAVFCLPEFKLGAVEITEHLWSFVLLFAGISSESSFTIDNVCLVWSFVADILLVRLSSLGLLCPNFLTILHMARLVKIVTTQLTKVKHMNIKCGTRCVSANVYTHISPFLLSSSLTRAAAA